MALTRSIRTRVSLAAGLALLLVMVVLKLVDLFGLPFTGHRGALAGTELEGMARLAILAELTQERLSNQLHDISKASVSVAGQLSKHSSLDDVLSSADAGNHNWWALAKQKEVRELNKLLVPLAGARGKGAALVDLKTRRILLSTEEELIGSQALNWSLVQRAAYDANHISDVERNGHSRIYACAQVSRRKRVVAVLLHWLDMDEQVRPYLNGLSGLGRTGEVLLADEDGKILVGGRHNIADPKKAVMTAVQGIPTDYRGRETLVAYRPFQGRHWGVLVKQDRAELVAATWRQHAYSIVLGIVGLLVFLGLTAVFTQHVLKPIQALSDAAAHVRDGDYDVHLRESRDDEIGELTSTFQSMVGHIKSSQDELEHEVEERTRKLQQTEEQLRSIYDAAESVSLITTNLAGKESVITSFSAGAERIFGYSKEDAIGHPIAILLTPEDIEQFPTMQMSLLAGQDEVSRESSMVHRSGDVFPALFAMHALRNEKGDVGGTLCVTVDITEQRDLEGRLRQSEKMEAIGQLAGGIAHDFNNQLAAVLGCADLLRYKAEDPQMQRYLKNIMTAAKRASDLTKQLLAFSRKGDFQEVAVNVHDVINEVTSMVRHSIDRRIVLRTVLNANPSRVIGDPTQLQNALLNLAINARDVMDDGGILSFATDVVILDADFCSSLVLDLEPGEYLQISVSDTGIGIPRDMLDRVFEPFFTTKPEGKGTGMGLAAVYGTVKRHRGSLRVCSEEGRGTTFKLYLPFASEAAMSCEQSSTELPQGFGGRILVVDDEELVREITSDMLRELGYEVISSYDGRCALELYQQEWRRIDLVVLDMIMPELNGHDAFLAMRQINPEVRAIIASGFGLDGYQNFLDEGLVALVQKPFVKHEIAKIVARALEDERELVV